MAEKQSITIQIPALMAVLKKAKEVMVANPPQDILENALFKVNDTDIQVIVTDTMVTMIGRLTGEVPAGVEVKPYSFLLPFEYLTKYCGQITTDTLTIELIQLKKYSNAVLTSFSGNTKIEGLADVSKFPELPEFPKENSIGISGEFISWLNVATHTVATNHQTMDKIYLGIDKNMLNVASCNHAVLLEKTFAIASAHTVDMLVSTKIAKALSGFEETTISWSDSNIAFVSNDITLINRLYDMKYPNYRRLFPAALASNLTVTHADLTTVMKKVSLTKSSVKIFLKKEPGFLLLESTDSEYNRTINEKIPCEYTGEVTDVTLLPKNVLELMGQVKYQTIGLSITAPGKPIIITTQSDDSYRALIQPYVAPVKK